MTPLRTQTLLLLLVLFMPSTYKAQEDEKLNLQPYIRQFGANSGLPSIVVHEVFQDSRGFLWFCTENGVSRYNGHEFINYNSSNLCSQTLIHGVEGSDGNVWFNTDLAQITVYQASKDEFYCPPKLNDTLQKYSEGQRIVQLGYHEDTLVFSVRYELHFRVVYDVEKDSLIYFDRRRSLSPMKFWRYREDFASVTICGNHNSIPTAQSPISRLDTNYKFAFAVRPSVHWVNGMFAATYGKIILLLDRDLNLVREKILPYDIIASVKYDNVSNILKVASVNGCLWLDPTTLEIVREEFNGYVITGIEKDREGGWWYSTLSSGVFYLSALNIQCLANDTSNSIIHCSDIFELSSKKAFIGTSSGGLYLYQSHSQNISKITTFPARVEELRWLISDSSKVTSMTNKRPWIDINDYAIKTPKFSRFTLMKDTNGVVVNLARGPGHLEIYDTNDTLIRIIDELKSTDHIRFVFQVDENFTYVAFGKSLGLIDYRKATCVRIPFRGVQSIRVTDVIRLQGDTFLISTKSSGLAIIKGSEVICRFDESDGLISTRCFSMREDYDQPGHFWIGSDIGIQHLEVKGERIIPGIQLRPESGYPVAPAKKLAVLGNKLLVATEINLFVIRTDSLREVAESCFDIRINSIRVQNKPLPRQASGGFELPLEYGSMSIYFEHACFLSNGKHSLRYRIPELYSNWIDTKSDKLVLQGLPAGDYTLDAQVIDLNGNWRTTANVVQFTVIVPFYEQWWFIPLVLVFLGLAMAYMVYIRGVWRSKTANLQLGLLEANNRALGAQLNPHFLYNVLNTVGGSLAKQNTAESLDLIGQFSRLMRNVFSNSRRDLITLKDEMEAVRSYVDLEKKRLGNKLEFRYINEKVEELEVYIPPLILQPIIENAIWHGIAHTDRPGIVELSIKVNGRNLQMEVRDNGVGGVDDEIEQNIEQNITSSLNVIKERLKLLNKIYGEPAKLQLKSSREANWSTLATLSFPIIRNPNERIKGHNH